MHPQSDIRAVELETLNLVPSQRGCYRAKGVHVSVTKWISRFVYQDFTCTLSTLNWVESNDVNK